MLTLTQTKKNKRPLLIALIIAVALIIAGVIIWNNSRLNANQQPSQQTPAPQSESPNPPSSQTPAPQTSNPTPQQNGELSIITENEQYKISQYKNTNKYVVTLYAIVNNPNQYDAYKEQLREYKQNALAYLKGQGVDITKAEIQYDPSEAASL